MRLCFDPVICSKAVLPEAVEIAKAAGFDAIVLHCVKTASSSFHPDTSVRVIRELLDEVGVTLAGLNIRNLTGLNDKGEVNPAFSLRQVEWDIHLARALRLTCANFIGGPRTDESREALVDGVNTLLEDIPDVTLNVGNSANTCLESAADFGALMPELPERAHIWLNATQMADAVKVVDAFADRVGFVTIGADGVDVVRALKASGYDGPVVIDLENATGDPVEIAREARERVEEALNA